MTLPEGYDEIDFDDRKKGTESSDTKSSSESTDSESATENGEDKEVVDSSPSVEEGAVAEESKS